MFLAVVLVMQAGYMYVLDRISGGRLSLFDLIFCGACLTVATILLIYACMCMAYRIRHGISLWLPPRPRKLPLWYRILSRFFN